MRKLKKQFKAKRNSGDVFPVIKDDKFPPLKRLSMDEYLAFISGNIRLFPDSYRNDNLEKWKKRIVPVSFVMR